MGLFAIYVALNFLTLRVSVSWADDPNMTAVAWPGRGVIIALFLPYWLRLHPNIVHAVPDIPPAMLTTLTMESAGIRGRG